MPTPALYYPQHFKTTRPYAKRFMAGIAELVGANNINPKTSYNLSAQCILAAYRECGIEPASPDFNAQGFTVENQATLMYAEWAQRGSAVYAFKEALTQALMATGVSQVTIAELQFPFHCAYFHFGAQPGLTLQSGAAVTGAYVMWAPGQALRLSLTAPLPADRSWSDRWAEVYDLRILARHFDKDIESAIEQALVDDIEDLRQAAKTLTSSENPHISDGAASTYRFIEAHAANKSTLARCFQLITNALCYLTAYPDDAQITWQDDTPQSLRTKADTAPGKEASRAASKLEAMGYRRVRHIGGEFSDASAHVEAGHVAPHWRRGHWRSQAYGPQMTLRKLIWLRPTRVLGGAASEEPRVYNTEAKDLKS